MNYKFYIFDRDNYASVNAAKADGALHQLDGFVIQDDYGFDGGMACDILECMQAAMRMIGQPDRLAAVLIDKNENVIDCRM
jgi:hypothetical protein